MPEFPDVSRYPSLLAILDDAATRWPAEPPMWSLRTDHGLELPWGPAEMRRRSLLAAWRLRAWGLQPGDRLLTWSPSSPRLPALYWGAMRAGVVLVPLDLRMTPGVIERISHRAETRWLVVDKGLDAPDPADVGLSDFDVRQLEDLVGDEDDTFAADWQAQVEAWPGPDRDTLFEIVFTSGTTADPKGVMLTHGNILETAGAFERLIELRHHRSVSILPLSHLFEQAPVLFYATAIGAELRYIRSRNPRIIVEAMREVRATVMVMTPQVLELFWTFLAREVERRGQTARFERARRLARRLPYRLRRLLFRSVHAQFGGALHLFISAGAYLAPELQQAWEDIGVVVIQGYGSTECGIVTANDQWHHPPGVVGRVREPSIVKLDPETSEILVRGPNVSAGYWRNDEATAASRDGDGWFLTGDVGRFDAQGSLVLSGRLRNIIVLPNGLNVYPEDIESALADRGLTQAVVVETAPGRVEAVVLPPGAQPVLRPGQQVVPARGAQDEPALAAEIDRLVKLTNADLSMHQRLAGWRLWPEPDFPRTHTLKIRRNEVRAWAGDEIALRVRETEEG
jgi:long-chain acyl-CoA synthetase